MSNVISRQVISSVGIDIGTTTTNVIFSQLTVENRASNFTVPRISIVDKQVVYNRDRHRSN
jgi:ethanolamine utilization protein EutA